jgi:hypothetical protein
MKNLVRGIVFASMVTISISLAAQTPTTAPTPATPPAAAAAPAVDPALTADDIVNKHVAAIGGKDVLSKVKTESLEGTFSMMGTENPTNITIVDGVGYKSEVEFNGAKIVQCFTDKGGWMINPMAGAATATPMPDDAYNIGKDQIYVGDPLYNYADKGSKVELLSKDGTAYKIKLTTKEKVEQTYLIDSTTFLVTSVASKGKMQDQDVDITTKLSDYRKTDLGLTEPYAIDVDLGGQFQISIPIKKVELNKTIDPAVFAMPK